MSFYPSERRCPRCRAPLTQGAPTCPNCGLALAGMGGAPRASRSGPSPWQPAEPEMYGAPPNAGRFGNQSNSGPAMYRPGGQPAPGSSGPWGDDAGASFQRLTSRYPQRPGASGGFSGAGNRFAGSGDASTSYQGRTTGQRQPPTGWDSESSYQDAPASYRNTPDSYRNTPSYYQDTPDDSWNMPGAWDRSAGARNAPADYPGTAGGFYDDEAAPVYGRGQAFRGAPAPSWQQSAFSAPPGVQHQYFGYFPPPDLVQEPPMPPPGRGKKVALVLLVIVVLLSVGGAAAYLYVQSRPAIVVTSKYMVGTTPAGAATTSLHVVGTKFAAHSAVSFLLDGQPEPGHRIFQSDGSGALKGDLPITADWALGQHSLTAKDASGTTTVLGKTIAIVPQGQAGTPGPHGAPADDTSFTITLIIHQHDNNSGEDSTGTDTLVITGQPNPAGGKVCNPKTDTGQSQTVNEADNGVKYTATVTVTCSGSYKGGKVTYKQTWSGVTFVFSNGVTCTAPPFTYAELDGSFTSAAALSGTLSGDSPTFTCSNGNSVIYKGMTGTWTGTIPSS